ncbi:MAG: DUF4412 domain-containing protein [Thermodesulfobacteriota bacterium]|nr:DUF4412 domain-containing protein [Thermodesulfobacteriota bacterium]
MLKRGFLLFCGLVSMNILSLSLSFSSISAAEFTADMVQDTGRGVINGKIFVKGDNLRQEMNLVETNQIMIFRGDKGVVWMLMPTRKMYIEMPATSEARAMHQFDQEKLEKMASKESLGKEAVNGYTCMKNRYTYYDKPSSTMTQWFSEKLNFPLRMEAKSPSGRVITEYKNLEEKVVSDALFEIPPDYKKMPVPAMMHGMTGGMPKMPEKMPEMHR